MYSITIKPFSWVTPFRNPRDPKPNHHHHHLPSISFTRRLRDFPSSATPISFQRCDFSCPNLFKRCDFSCPNPLRKRWCVSCLKRFEGPIRLPEREENDAHYYQSGGINMALWGPLLGAEPVLGKVGRCIRPFLAKLAPHPAPVALTLALMIPMLLSLLVERERKRMRKWSAAFWMIFNNKGNLCSFWAAHFAITTWVAIHKGVSGAHFAFGCWYAFSTLLDDEFGLAWHRGLHAEIRNKIVEDFFQGHPISHRKLKVLLGDPWLQIIAAALLGISVTFICHQGFMGAA